MFKNKKILIGVSGSIAAYKSCELISSLKKQGALVRVLATTSALEFVGKASFEGLSGEKILTSDFSEGSMMEHIHLSKWADVFVIAPATAQTLNSLATGTGHGILTSTFLAYDLSKPLLIAPAMNTQMLLHPTTQSSLTKLKEMGIEILDTDDGQLACGDVGLGRLIAPEKIITRLEELFSPVKKLSVLITAGGTKVPIDDVRSLTNTSTGQTGSNLADFFTQKNYDVDLLLAKNGFKPTLTSSVSYFETYDDLNTLMKEKLSEKKYDYIFHAAAVSDYQVDATAGKLASGKELQITLKPTEKIVSHLKEWSPDSQVVAFKLTSTENKESQLAAVDKLFKQPIDWVIHNDLGEISADQHRFTLYNRSGAIESATSKKQLAQNIERMIFNKESK